jgi:flotillin
MGLIAIWALVSFVLVLFPFLGPALIPGFEMGGGSQIIMLVIGIISLVGLSAVVVITKLYRKTKANQALVRTGMGGMKVVLDGGCLVIPVIHQVIEVSLQSMRLDVVRKEHDALICKDNLRANLSAEFYIKVEADKEQVTNASRSLGDRATDAEKIKDLVMEKLVNALRDVAAKSELHQLHADRDAFAGQVKEAVATDLAHNGLTLESVTISQLDQTNMEGLDKNNVFNAPGLRRAAEIIQKNLVETNEINRQSELAIEQKNVETDKALYGQELERAQAKSILEKDKRLASSKADREAKEFELAQEEEVAKREIAKDRQVDLENVNKEQLVEIANRKKDQEIIAAEQAREVADKDREKAVRLAEVGRDQAAEIALRNQQIAIADEEEKRAAAEEKRLQAEAKREEADQQVKTVEAVKSAERVKETQVIEASAAAETKYVTEKRDADAEAYRLTAIADGQKAASEADYDAKVKAAEAEQVGLTKKAEGQKAVDMVPVQVAEKQVAVTKASEMIAVEVAEKQVAVNKAQVLVDRAALEQTQEFGEAGIKLQIALARIEADKDIRIAQATALGTMINGADMTVFGDPTTLAAMTEKYATAMGFAKSIDGFTDGLVPGDLAETAVKGGVEAILHLINAGASRLEKDQGMTADNAKAFVTDLIKNVGVEAAQKVLGIAEETAAPATAPAAPSASAPDSE